jgi:uncharacterized membrane protein YvbJ
MPRFLSPPVPELSPPELIYTEKEGKTYKIFEKYKMRRAQERLFQENSLSRTDLYFQCELEGNLSSKKCYCSQPMHL